MAVGQNGLDASAKPASGENRVCPMTGAVGYCPMAKPKGYDPNEKKPELKVLMMLMWEDGDAKVSIGVYPHMSQHWEALELPDTSTNEEIKTQFRKLSIKFHPDKNKSEGAKEKFQRVNEAYTALKDVNGALAFPWEENPKRQQRMKGIELLKTFGSLGSEAASTDPIKAQMMQHVIKESDDCKLLLFKKTFKKGVDTILEVQADALCTDSRHGSNHLVKVYRRVVTTDAGPCDSDEVFLADDSSVDNKDTCSCCFG